ncbi:MAG: apolipoprotein N-acyltransferase [Bifidobacteriaceae bacterium]|jgi:apolipoprotein N-acyltransferase|nr:apolipoprotein N-acyltransferase [Bifidobacteriaceae bacterium]
MPSNRWLWISLAGAGLSGFVSFLAFRPAGWWFAAPLALAGLYALVRPVGPGRGLVLALVFGLAEFLPMLTWAHNAAGLLPYLALSVASAGLFALGAVLYGCARWLAPGQGRTGAAAGGRRGSGGGRGGGRARASGGAGSGGGRLSGGALSGGALSGAGRGSGRRGTASGIRPSDGRTGWRGGPSALDGLLFAAAITAADTFRQFFPFGGFPWGRLGFTQVGGPMARWAWLGGAPLVGLAAALAGSFLVVALAAVWRRRWRTAAVGAGGLAFALVAPLALPISAGAEGGTIAVGAVQGDVEVTSEGLFARQREVLENHVAVSLVLAQEVGPGALDVVLWPENSTDIDPRTDRAAYAAIDQAATALDAPLLVGAMQYVGRANRYNQGLLWRGGLGVVDVYSKRHPAPFAEYVPGRSFFRLFTSKVDLINTDMLAGQTIGLMRFDAPVLGRSVAMGDIICFEVAYDSIVADVVADGAEFVVVQTNNASFGFSEEATQQFAMTRLRAIEHGRSVVQISTVGVSAAVAPDGSLLTPLTTLFEPAFFTADLPLRTSVTPATRIGGLVCWALMIGPLGLAVAGLGARLARGGGRSRRVSGG